MHIPTLVFMSVPLTVQCSSAAPVTGPPTAPVGPDDPQPSASRASAANERGKALTKRFMRRSLVPAARTEVHQIFAARRLSFARRILLQLELKRAPGDAQ